MRSHARRRPSCLPWLVVALLLVWIGVRVSHCHRRGEGSDDASRSSPGERGAAPPAVHDLLAYLVEDPDGGTVLRVVDAATRGDRALAYQVVPAGRLRWDPSGSRLAVVLEKGDREALVTVRADGRDAAVISGDRDLGANSQGHLYWYEWCPSGQFMAFAVAKDGEPGGSRGDVYVVDIGRETPWLAATDVLMRDGMDGRGLPTMAWSPDGQWLALCDGRAVSLVSPDTSARATAAGPDGRAVDSFLWSSDGTRLALFTRAADYTTAASVYHLPDGPCRVVATGVQSGEARWAPGGAALALPSAGTAPTSLGVWRAGEDWALLATGEVPVREYSWLGQQLQLVVVARQAGGDILCTADPSGADLQRLSDLRDAFWPTPDPQGDRIAFCVRGGRSGEDGIYIAARSGGELMLVHRAVPDSRPIWSPDGAQLLYRLVARPSQTTDAFVARVSGEPPSEARVNGALDAHTAAWSPSGRFVAIESTAATSRALAIAQVGAEPVVVSQEVVTWEWPEVPSTTAPGEESQNEGR